MNDVDMTVVPVSETIPIWKLEMCTALTKTVDENSAQMPMPLPGVVVLREKPPKTRPLVPTSRVMNDVLQPAPEQTSLTLSGLVRLPWMTRRWGAGKCSINNGAIVYVPAATAPKTSEKAKSSAENLGWLAVLRETCSMPK